MHAFGFGLKLNKQQYVLYLNLLMYVSVKDKEVTWPYLMHLLAP